MFLVFERKVRVDFDGASTLGVTAVVPCLVRPATITKLNYSMTATIMKDAELGFLAQLATQPFAPSPPNSGLPLANRVLFSPRKGGASMPHNVTLVRYTHEAQQSL